LIRLNTPCFIAGDQEEHPSLVLGAESLEGKSIRCAIGFFLDRISIGSFGVTSYPEIGWKMKNILDRAVRPRELPWPDLLGNTTKPLHV
jgi:hypothetical protein